MSNDNPTFLSGVARNFERGFPNDRAGDLGGTAPPKNEGLGFYAPRKIFEFYTKNACKNSVYK